MKGLFLLNRLLLSSSFSRCSSALAPLIRLLDTRMRIPERKSHRFFPSVAMTLAGPIHLLMKETKSP